MLIAPPKLLTYEDYLAEGEINLRYDIIDGERIFMHSPTRDHQSRLFNVATLFKVFTKAFGLGQMQIAPCDVLVTRYPTRTRQPDVLFISNERLALNPPSSIAGALDPAPELVVEILSPSDTETVLEAKLADYCAVDVREAWIVNQNLQTVAVKRLSASGHVTVATYGMGETVQSITFPDLTVAVADIFAD